MASEAQSGGCQCGAVRFRIEGNLGDASVCHCRMCQKAFGSFYAPLVSVREASLTWTRGGPKKFHSSNFAERGFCADCGTPLTYQADGHEIELAIGALDHPEMAAPTIQVNPADRLPYFEGLANLPMQQRSAEREPFYAAVVSYQHPDHDTTRSGDSA